MRRPVTILVGLLLATGAGFAMAGPASAAVSHDSHVAASTNSWWDDDDDEYNFSDDDEYNYRNDEDNDFNGNEQNGIFLLSGIGQGLFNG